MASRILLITPKHHGFENKIKSALEESGYNVFWFENKNLTLDYHSTKSKFKIIRKLYFLIFSPEVRYIRKQLKLIDDHKFNILFSINGYVICSYLIRHLKKQNPDLFSVFYLWDSFSIFSWIDKLKYFDKVYTFDPVDSQKFGIEYKPLFFIKNISLKNSKVKADIFFVGKFSSDRFYLIDEIISRIKEFNVICFFKVLPDYKIFLHNYFLYFFLKRIQVLSVWIKNYILNYEVIEGIIKRDYFIYQCIRFEEVQNQLLNSNVILDICFPEQNGYSHRLVEALAMGKKIITTNKYIKNENFYNSEQIHIIDHINPELDYKWIKETSNFKRNNLFSELELSAWLKSIINVGVS